jgi:hypothetical protein
MVGPSIQLKHVISRRGPDLVMTDEERLVYEAILRDGVLPAGGVIFVGRIT